MIETFEISPGVYLRCRRDLRFKQGCLSVQLVRPMDKGEAALNALLCAVLLRGSKSYRDMQAITGRLDELYGASVSTMVRRVGDYQTTGFYCGFMEDRFCLPGDRILEPLLALVRELLLEPVLEDGVFCRDFVEGEKRNLIATIQAEGNDKRAYAADRLFRNMCREDSFGVSRLGEVETVQAITAEVLYSHYQKILKESRVELFYVGSSQAGEMKALAEGLLAGVDRDYVNLPAQTPFYDAGGSDLEETMDIAQGKLCLGFAAPVTIRDDGFAAMQMLNLVFGGGMTSKLFQTVREKMSLCYAIASGYHGSKGIMTVSAGIDSGKKEQTLAEILHQLDECRRGNITQGELTAARQAMASTLQAIHDSPGSIENYYATAALSGLRLSPGEYLDAVERVTAADIAAAAGKLRLHSSFFLKGDASC